MLRPLLISLLLFASSIYTQQIPEQFFSTEKLSNHYSPQFLRILQIVFGTDELLSEGGYDSVDHMFASIDLSHKKVLDVGCGFGGVGIYLAEKFDVEIVGVDIEPYMTAAANSFLKKHQNLLKGRVSFHTLADPFRLDEFQDETFDIVFCKESFYNVPMENKQAYLSEIYRKLKPGGTIIFSDWMQNTSFAGEALQRATKNGKICQFLTPKSFCQALESANFQEIQYENHTEEYIQYTIQDCKRLSESKDLLVDLFGETIYLYRVEAWKSWLEAQIAGELIAGYIFARK